jgi:hypothetical protein
MKNKILFLEKRIDFLQERLLSFEKDTGPIYNLLPVRLHDLVPLEHQPSNETFLLVVLVEKENRASVIKVPRNVLIKLSETTKEITIDDYILTDKIAERRLSISRNGKKTKKWVWKLI